MPALANLLGEVFCSVCQIGGPVPPRSNQCECCGGSFSDISPLDGLNMKLILLHSKKYPFGNFAYYCKSCIFHYDVIGRSNPGGWHKCP